MDILVEVSGSCIMLRGKIMESRLTAVDLSGTGVVPGLLSPSTDLARCLWLRAAAFSTGGVNGSQIS
jgi:hypothetical protein